MKKKYQEGKGSETDEVPIITISQSCFWLVWLSWSGEGNKGCKHNTFTI